MINNTIQLHLVAPNRGPRTLQASPGAVPGVEPTKPLHSGTHDFPRAPRPAPAMLESLPAGLIAWLAFVVLLAGVLQGALGFGFPFVATPLIALAADMRTAVIVVLLPTLATICVPLLTSGPLRPTLARFWYMPIYSMLGAAAGTWVFVSAPEAPYTLVLALLTL